ncbi:putative mitochondrial protein [Cucumis melo var. makuwa]|uniref:Mitochondrial protein n=1 Tax=Cucumis melo var. makuwa TaxID=1194695 RepID=A0A5D3DTN6_CUCMM|nr:putative mitochondrial protein [Cucumis melo var. makuwa]TYK27041.1 putative mitochondrial protein [Cucumis melo var. makuwa]
MRIGKLRNNHQEHGLTDLPLKSQGYNQGHSDQILFTKVSKIGKIAILIVYVNDIELYGDDTNEIIQLKKKMAFGFEIKNLGNLKYFLGMEIARSREDLAPKGVVRSGSIRY